jgi:hypothetical protein
MIEDSQAPEAEPNMRGRGPTDGLALCAICGGESALDPTYPCRPCGSSGVVRVERAALLATRQRYEAALRRIAAKGHPHGESYNRPDWCHVCMAREALAGAPEETP